MSNFSDVAIVGEYSSNGVSQIIAGTNISINPIGGQGIVQVNNTMPATLPYLTAYARNNTPLVLSNALQDMVVISTTATRTGKIIVETDIIFLSTSGTTSNIDSYIWVNGASLNAGQQFRINTTGNAHYVTCSFSFSFNVVAGVAYSINIRSNIPSGGINATKTDATLYIMNTE